MPRDLKLITGNSNLGLAKEIAEYIGQELKYAEPRYLAYS